MPELVRWYRPEFIQLTLADSSTKILLNISDILSVIQGDTEYEEKTYIRMNKGSDSGTGTTSLLLYSVNESYEYITEKLGPFI